MKKNALFILFSALISASAFADVIKCNFTEPFYSTVYNTRSKTLGIYMAGLAPKMIQDISFQVKGDKEYELVSKDGNVLQQLSLNHQGSDGMSDRVYSYSVQDNSTGKAQWGGCFKAF